MRWLRRHRRQGRSMNAPALLAVAVHPAEALLQTITAAMPPELARGALCGADPELHTGPDAFADEPAEERNARVQVAKEVCAECPVKVACLRRALRLRPEAGVWAGFTAAELSGLAELLDASPAGVA